MAKRNTSMTLVGATRYICVGFKAPGEGLRVRQFIFRPNAINRIPSDVWGALQAKPMVGVYLEEGILWELQPTEANAIKDGKARLLSPKGEFAGVLQISPTVDSVLPSDRAKGLEDSLTPNGPEIAEIDVAAGMDVGVLAAPEPVV